MHLCALDEKGEWVSSLKIYKVGLNVALPERE